MFTRNMISLVVGAAMTLGVGFASGQTVSKEDQHDYWGRCRNETARR